MTLGTSDADVARQAGIAQFAIKPDGGSMWGDFVVTIPAEQLARVTGNALTGTQRALLMRALESERRRGYYFEADLERMLANTDAGAAESKARYDVARAAAVAAEAAAAARSAAGVNPNDPTLPQNQSRTSPAAKTVHPVVGPVLVDQVSGVPVPVGAPERFAEGPFTPADARISLMAGTHPPQYTTAAASGLLSPDALTPGADLQVPAPVPPAPHWRGVVIGASVGALVAGPVGLMIGGAIGAAIAPLVTSAKPAAGA